MNETLIKRHFAKAFKSGMVVVHGMVDGRVVISDASCMLFLDKDSLVFESRLTWPKLPKRGQTFLYRNGFEETNFGFKMNEKIIEWSSAANLNLKVSG
jgi:hypothetical protein